MAWKSFDYLKRYEQFSSAMLNGKKGIIEVSRLESIWIKYQSDLEMVLEIVNKNNIWDFIHWDKFILCKLTNKEQSYFL